MSVSVRALAFVALLALNMAVPAHAELHPGSWVGWAYLGDDAGDLPLRIWAARDGTVTFDGVAWRAFGWPTTMRATATGDIELATRTTKGTAIRLNGPVQDGRYAGFIQLGDHQGEFELNHSRTLMIPLDPARYADIEGHYAMDDGDVLEVRPRGWGEMVVRSLRTGQQRTLFPSGPDRFWTGSAMYVPDPPEDLYAIRRDRTGALTGVVRTNVDGTTSVGDHFTLRSEEVTFGGDGIQLAGRITRIDDARPRPGIVICGGSGWTTREDHGFHVRSLAALGFAVLSYDKRGFGESEGRDPTPFQTTANDAAAAARWLRQRDDTDGVGLFGISRGGWIAPLAATQAPDVGFLILFVPPATSPADQEHESRLARLREDGYAHADIAHAARTLDAAWTFLEDESGWTRFHQLATQALGRGLPEYVVAPDDLERDTWAWARLNMSYDPLPALRALRVPVLAVFGETDLSVLTATHRPALQRALERAGNPDVTIITIPDAGHDLAQPSDHPTHRFTGLGDEGHGAVLAWVQKRALVSH